MWGKDDVFYADAKRQWVNPQKQGESGKKHVQKLALSFQIIQDIIASYGILIFSEQDGKLCRCLT